MALPDSSSSTARTSCRLSRARAKRSMTCSKGLRRDPRHTGLEVRDRHRIGQRSFPDWAMELVRVKAGYFEARDTIAERLPDTVPEEIRARLFRMTELISTMEFD